MLLPFVRRLAMVFASPWPSCLQPANGLIESAPVPKYLAPVSFPSRVGARFVASKNENEYKSAVLQGIFNDLLKSSTAAAIRRPKLSCNLLADSESQKIIWRYPIYARSMPLSTRMKMSRHALHCSTSLVSLNMHHVTIPDTDTDRVHCQHSCEQYYCQSSESTFCSGSIEPR
jgi:hypothetical protein